MALINILEPIKEEKKQDEIIVGIDLGTTNSLIAIINDKEQVHFFKDENGNEIIPSIVEILGEKICSIKRLMGKNFDEVKSQKFPFKIAEGENGSIKILVGNEKFSPEEISAKILEKLKTIAEKELKTEVKKAVITVPAYFDEGAKNATKLSAKLAGLEVLRLVNEPTAGALAYGLENQSKGCYAIYDLGGGTFDVSILKMQKGIFRVLGVSGNNQLGGDDFDNLIAKELGISKAKARLLKENINQTPTYNEETNFSVIASEAKQSKNCNETKNSHNENFNLSKFNELIFPLVQETIKLTKNLISDLELEIDEIDGVILIGGSTRISLIKEELSKIFGKDKILDKLDPDRIVAHGASWQAYNLSGKGNNLLLDVIPLSLGLEMFGGIVDKIILRNSTIPTQVTKEFTTHSNNQTGMKFHVVQGERELAKDCRSLANFEIKDIPPLLAGKAKISITFKVDADGLLTVSAEEKITNQKQEIIVKPSFGLDENETRKMLLDSLQNSKADISNRLLIEKINEASKDLELVRQDLTEFGYLVDKSEKERIEVAIFNLEKKLQLKESREEIKKSHDELVKTAENLILQKVNLAIEKKIGGKNLSEF